MVLNGQNFTLSTFADNNKNINFANKIYSYKSKYPHLFIYPKKNFEINKKQLLVDDIKFLINKYLKIIDTLIVNEEKKIYDLNTPGNFLSTNCDIKSDDLIFAHNKKLKDELMSVNIVKRLNISKNITKPYKWENKIKIK